jgi:hypothetical protein
VVAPDMRRSVVTIPGCKPIPRKLKKKANKKLLIMMASSMIAINDDNTTAVKRKGS